MLGVEVQIHTSKEGITSQNVLNAIESVEKNGGQVRGWCANGVANIYLPHIFSIDDIVETIMHESVGHKSISDIFTEEERNILYDNVWDSMSEQDQQKFLGYVKSENNQRDDDVTLQRKAADEYVAHIAEKLIFGSKLNEKEKSVWSKIINFFKYILGRRFTEIDKDYYTESGNWVGYADIELLLLAAHKAARKGGSMQNGSAESEGESFSFIGEKGATNLDALEGASETDGASQVKSYPFSSWLTQENIEWAEGRNFEEIEERFGNELVPIATIPHEVALYFGLADENLHSGKAYFIDHAANHHPEVTLDEYEKIQEVIEDYDDIKDLSSDKQQKVAFIKKLDKGYAVVAEVSKKEDKLLLHKTFFYKDSKGTRVPYKNKPSIKNELPVDGSTTISPIKSNSRQTPNISALGDSTDKGKNNVPTKQGEVDNITKETENLTFSNKNDDTQGRSADDGNIDTAGIFKMSYGKNRKEVHNRHTTVKQSTETAETSQVTEQGGTTEIHSMYAPTTSNRKGTDNSANEQEEVGISFSVKPISGNRNLQKGLRKLENGETCHVERMFVENKYFEFSSVNRIKSYSDVAYIFRQLEDEAVENVFAVLVKSGRPTVIHLGMGNYNQSMVNRSALNVAVNRVNPDKIYFVHNHPSGTLKASNQDLNILNSLKEEYGSKVSDGIIINARSGQYALFNEETISDVRPTDEGLSDITDVKPLKVYSFTKQAFDKNYNPKNVILGSADVAEFVSSHRLGDRKKLGLIVINNSGSITGNIFLPYSDFTSNDAASIVNDIIYYTSVMGGTRAIMFGNAPLNNIRNKQIGLRIKEFTQLNLLDYVQIDGGRYFSAHEEGVSFSIAKSTSELDAIAKEEAAIISEAKANGTYLKAPNGRPTNLTPKQWVEVRTKRFKNWFGDWEKVFRIQKLKKSKSVTVAYNNEYELNRDSAKQWMKDNLRGEYINKDTDESIIISKVGINEVTSHGSHDEIHLKSLTAIPQMIEQSIFIEERANNKAHDKYDSYRYYVCGLNVDGVDYTAKIVVGVKNGSKYYDHRLTQIEKGTLIESLNGLSNSVAENQNASISIGKDTKLLSLLQINSSKIVDENGEPMVVYHGTPHANFTIFQNGKIRNTNGGKFAIGTFTTTDLNTAKRYAQIYVSDSPSTKGYYKQPLLHRLLGYPKLPIPNSEATKEYAPKMNEGANNYRYVLEAPYGTFDRGVYSLFLNIRNPKIIDYNNKPWSSVPYELPKKYSVEIEKNGETTDILQFNNKEEAEKYVEEYFKENSKNLINSGTLPNTGKGWVRRQYEVVTLGYYLNNNKDDYRNIRLFEYSLPRNINGVASATQDEGYDGLIAKNVNDANIDGDANYAITDIVAFNPNQIKSATDNNGNYSTENDDIRFSTLEEINDHFNEELDGFSVDNADRVVFNLGEPSSILQAAGVENKTMKLYGSKVAKKMQKHGFAVEELRNLPRAIANPIAVFNNYNKDGNRSILTELHTEQGNFLVTLSIGRGQDVDFNIVSSVFGKGENNIINWLNNGYATYINKEKALNYLHLATPIVAASNNQELVSATKVVETFENPPIVEQKNAEEGSRFSIVNRNQVGFVSNAMKAVEGIKQEKATPSQWLAMIQKQGGLKVGEDKWLGLSDWLKSSGAKTLNTDDLLEFIGENMIQIEEVNYTETADSFNELKEEYENLVREEGFDVAQDEMTNRFGDDFNIAFEDLGGELTISDEEAAAALLGSGNIINRDRLDYTTEGLANKREIALTVPTIESWNRDDEIHFGDAGDGRAVAWIRFGETFAYDVIDDVQVVNEFHAPYKGVTGRDVYRPIGGSARDYVVHGKGRNGEMIYVVYINEKQLPVAHATLEDARIAMNEYYKEHPRKLRKPRKVLVIDEIQSKRHQDGREKGYRSNADKTHATMEELTFGEYNGMTKVLFRGERFFFKKETSKEEILDIINDRIRDGQLGVANTLVPDAPFDKNWHELAMKRMLRLAAEEGFDKVAWTKGEQQAKRYDIGAVVNRIESTDMVDYDSNLGVDLVKQVVLFTRYGDAITLRLTPEGIVRASSHYNGHHISDIVGKELGNRIMTEADLVLKEQDLRIGGEGMKGFYDKILPSFLNKYGKKWGVKVGEVTLPELEESAQRMWAIDVTPEMKESVGEQTMFSAKRTAPETESALEEEHHPSVVSSADGAKVLKKMDSLIKDYDESAIKRPNTFLGDVAQALGATKHGSNSQYATFETMNGNIVTIRLSNHNARVSTFDNHNEQEGISIVVTAQDNNGVDNDGTAHVVEFFYDAIKLRKADGKPLVEILKSIKQSLYSGVYKDTTGLAEREEVNTMFSTVYHDSNLKIEDRTMFSFAKTPEEFDAVQKEAERQKGIVAPGLNSANVNIVNVERHDFTGTGNEAIQKARKWANENIVGEHVAKEGTLDEFTYIIDDNSIKKYLSSVSTRKSDNLGVHLSVLKQLLEVINNSIETEIHADYKKTDSRSKENGVEDKNLLIHRFYGCVRLNDELHRVKVTLKERKSEGVKPYSYEVTKIELLSGSSQNGTSWSNALNNSISGAKLLENVEKSYDPGVKLLDASEKNSESPSLFSIRPEFLTPISEGLGDIDNETFSIIPASTIAQEWYDEAVRVEGGWKGFRNKFAESWFDEVRSVLKLQEAIEMQTGKPIRGMDNAYAQLIALSSKNHYDLQLLMDKNINPLTQFVDNMIRGKKLYGVKVRLEDVERYLNAKHGLERNRVMARRDAEEQATKDYNDELAKLNEQLKADPENQSLKNRIDAMEAGRTSRIESETERIYQDIRSEKDYSGLTELFQFGNSTLSEIEESAQEYVDDFERVMRGKTTELWSRINGISKGHKLMRGDVCTLVFDAALNNCWDVHKVNEEVLGEMAKADEFGAYAPLVKKWMVDVLSEFALKNNQKKECAYAHSSEICCTLSGIRTLDPLIKSQLLYQLS